MSTEPESTFRKHNRSRLTDSQPTKRVTFRTTDKQLEKCDALIDDGQFPNRSETVRVAVVQLLERENGGERWVN